MRFNWLKYIFLPVCMVVAMLSCIPEDAPFEDEPQDQVPAPEPIPTPTPEPEPEPEPDIPSSESSYDAIRNMGVGWNLGNTLDAVWWNGGTDGRDWRAWETGWGQPVTRPELMTMMKNAGFGAIRVPVTWGVHMDADGRVFDEWMNRVNEIVDYVLDAGMYCIINVHHDTGAESDAWLVADPQVYENVKGRYESLWRQIAERFRSYDHRLLFESYNEMLDESRSWCYASMNLGYDAAAATRAYDAINSYAQSFVDVVRATGGNNSVRNLVVNTYGACNGSGTWSQYLADPLIFMKKPTDTVEDHLLFQVHAYPMIDDLPSMETEVSEMFRRLDLYLATQGCPVIIGEWGTFSEDPSIGNLCYYADYFVSKAKEYGMGTFHWMSLSDGFYRSLPAFSHPEIAEAIVKAYHGDGFAPQLPLLEDFDLACKVTYHTLWSEANLHPSVLDLTEYKGIFIELEEVPERGSLSVKVYGDSDGKEQYVSFDGSSAIVYFDSDILGTRVNRTTLQCFMDKELEVILKDISLIKSDGTLESSMPSVFWGCDVELIITDRISEE